MDDFRPKIGHSDCLTSSKLRRSWRLNRVAWLMWFFSCVIRSERTTPFLCEKIFEDISDCWQFCQYIPSWLFLCPVWIFLKIFKATTATGSTFTHRVFQMVWESESVQSVNTYTVLSYLKILSMWQESDESVTTVDCQKTNKKKNNPRNYWVKVLELVTVHFKSTKL